jgi:dTDP-4-dehydrorhamnose reductase
MTNILLTGVDGQLGYELYRQFSSTAHVVSTVLDPALFPAVLPKNTLTLDLADPEAIERVIARTKPDVIINPAAYTAVDKAETEVDLARAINTTAPAVMARAARQHGCLLIHYSTDYVFDGSGDTPWTESAPTAPLGVYGLTKRDGEQEILTSGCRHLILRTSWVYGAHGQNFVKTMLRLARDRERLAVVNDQIGAPTSARVLARATAQILEALQKIPSPPSGLFHAVCQGETSWHGFAEEIFRLARLAGFSMKLNRCEAIPSSAYPTPARRPLNSRLNTSRLQREWGITTASWQEALKEMMPEILRSFDAGGRS